MTTLTGLIPTLNAALSGVSRELIGFIPNVTRDATAQSGAVGQTVRSPVVPEAALEDIAAGATPIASGAQTIGYVDISISKSKAYPILWTGEEQLSVTKDGIINTILQDQFANGFRVLANAVEADLAALYAAASRAYGTSGTAPFGTTDNHTDFAGMNRILDENGAPQTGRAMVLGAAARANLEGKQASLFKINEAGDAGALLRDRQMRSLHGFTMGFSAQVKAHTAGAAFGSSPDYLTDITSPYYAVGDTTIHLDTGVGAHKAGDVITFAGDTSKYVIKTGATGNGDKDIVLGAPGLRFALGDGKAATIDDSYTANMAFHRTAMVLAARVPAMPIGGDNADDVTVVQDAVSGLVFQVAKYTQYRQVKFEIGLAWGVGAANAKWLAVLQG